MSISHETRESMNDLTRLIAQTNALVLMVGGYENVMTAPPEAVANLFWLLCDQMNRIEEVVCVLEDSL